MCQAYAAEAAFVRAIESRYPRCDVCGCNSAWHDWRCEGHPNHEEWKNSYMYDPRQTISRKEEVDETD